MTTIDQADAPNIAVEAEKILRILKPLPAEHAYMALMSAVVFHHCTYVKAVELWEATKEMIDRNLASVIAEIKAQVAAEAAEAAKAD